MVKYRKIILLAAVVALFAASYAGATGTEPIAVRVGTVRFWDTYEDWASYPPGRPDLDGGREYISRDYEVPYPYDQTREIDYFIVRGVVAANQQVIITWHHPEHTSFMSVYPSLTAGGADTQVDVDNRDIGHWRVGILCAEGTEADGWVYIAAAVLNDATTITFEVPTWSGDNPWEPDVPPPEAPITPIPPTPTVPDDPIFPSLPDPGHVDPPDPGGSWPPPVETWEPPVPDIPVDPGPGEPGGPVDDPVPTPDDPVPADPLPGDEGGLPAPDDPLTPDPIPVPDDELTPDPIPVPDDELTPDPIPVPDDELTPDPIPEADPLPTPDDPLTPDPIPDLDPLPPVDPLPEVDPLPGGD